MKILIAVAAAPKKVKSVPRDPKVDAALKRMMTNALKSAGFSSDANFEDNTKSPRPGLHIGVIKHSGIAYDHAVPIAQRGKDKKSPTYYRVFFGVFVNGETSRHTVDGPIGNDRYHYQYSHRFDGVPSAAELKAVGAELKTKVKEGHKVYLDLIKKYKPTKK